MECVRYVAAAGGIWSNWVAGDFIGPPEVPGPMPCKRRVGEHACTAKNEPVGSVSLINKSGWIIDEMRPVCRGSGQHLAKLGRR